MSSKSQMTDGLRSTLHVGNDIILNNKKILNDSIETTSTTNKSNGDVTKCIEREHSSSAFMKIKTYLLALRPWSLSASLVPTILGSALSYRTSSEFNFITFILTIFTVITVHGAGNVVNTYYDYVKGIDNRKSDDRTLVDHILSKDEVITFFSSYCFYIEFHLIVCVYFRWSHWVQFYIWPDALVLYCCHF